MPNPIQAQLINSTCSIVVAVDISLVKNKMPSFPEPFLTSFHQYLSSSSYLKACHFDKSPRRRKLGDLAGVLPYHVVSQSLNREVVNEEMSVVGFPWANDVVFNFDDQRVHVTFNRSTCCRHTLGLISDSLENYGSNHVLSHKALSLTLATDIEDQSLTSCREQITHEILLNLIEFCGGQTGVYSLESSNLIVSHKSNLQSNGNVLILVGTVKCDDAQTLEAYSQLRAQEIISMCENKLENQILASECPRELASAALRFDLMQSSLSRSVQIHLNYNDPTTLTRCKGAIFVLYNYVRIEHILNKFSEEVTASAYPELPPVDEVNFAELFNEDEWNLMLCYVMWWPCVVNETIEDLNQGRPKLHRLFLFLMALSSDFSVYYHRTRILLGTKLHLIPLVHARIHLLLGIRQVYQNALRIVGLKPLKNM